MIAALKAIHIAAMLCWCAALVALPLLLLSYGRARDQRHYTEFRLLTHYGYVGFASPAAVIAVAAGTALIFAAQVFDLWFAAKLAFVSAMALIHALIGQMIEHSGEAQARKPGHGPWPRRGKPMILPLIALIGGLACIGAVLWLVLAKPDLDWLRALLPRVLLAPLEQMDQSP